MTVELLPCPALVATYEKLVRAHNCWRTNASGSKKIGRGLQYHATHRTVCALHVIRWCSILAGRVRITTTAWRTSGDRTLPLLPHSMYKVELEGGEQNFARFLLSTRAIGAESLVLRWYYLRLKTA